MGVKSHLLTNPNEDFNSDTLAKYHNTKPAPLLAFGRFFFC
jgi:hypothetical protein